MVRFILVTFAFLGWAFYELSGGSEYEPARLQLTNVTVDTLKPAVSTAPKVKAAPDAPIEVTRVSLNLTSVDDVLEGRAAVPVNLPQQKQLEPEIVTNAVQQGEAVTLIPSLATGADTTQQPQPVAVSETSAIGFFETRIVSGNRVNVRGGPGTDYNVVGRLVRGDSVEILEDTGTGWVRFQAVGGDTQGWIADFLLTSN